MARCTFCGESAGFFRSHHDECKEADSLAWESMVAIAADAAIGKWPVDSLETELIRMAESNKVLPRRIDEAIVGGWERAVERVIEDGVLSFEVEEHLRLYVSGLSLSQATLDGNGTYTLIVKMGVLRDLTNGIFPTRVQVEGTMPFRFQRDESLIWIFQDVEYFEERKYTEYRGGSEGVSFGVLGGSYNLGLHRATPFERENIVLLGTGLMGVTNRHLYFFGAGKSFRIPHDKMVSLERFSDGVAIYREAAGAPVQVFLTGDGWFLHSLLMSASNA